MHVPLQNDIKEPFFVINLHFGIEDGAKSTCSKKENLSGFIANENECILFQMQISGLNETSMCFNFSKYFLLIIYTIKARKLSQTM